MGTYLSSKYVYFLGLTLVIELHYALDRASVTLLRTIHLHHSFKRTTTHLIDTSAANKGGKVKMRTKVKYVYFYFLLYIFVCKIQFSAASVLRPACFHCYCQ